ncbi:MAG TPA: DUF1858 domain-containing protein [Candidatus Baltobacteraceae bacterium]|nr:DUF1858 domain-containing protein [Candidatus Baltobacteraceae bacterium]
MSIPITPETKVGDLLTAYPALEPVLIQYAPAFKALQNPILRRTVARVASLAQAAQVGGVPVRDLVAALRTTAGIDDDPDEPTRAQPEEATPDWVDDARVKVTIDVDQLLAVGEVPLVHAQRALHTLGPDALIRVTSSFRPAPLTDALRQAGHRTFSTPYGPGRFHTYICPKACPHPRTPQA